MSANGTTPTDRRRAAAQRRAPSRRDVHRPAAGPARRRLRRRRRAGPPARAPAESGTPLQGDAASVELGAQRGHRAVVRRCGRTCRGLWRRPTASRSTHRSPPSPRRFDLQPHDSVEHRRVHRGGSHRRARHLPRRAPAPASPNALTGHRRGPARSRRVTARPAPALPPTCWRHTRRSSPRRSTARARRDGGSSPSTTSSRTTRARAGKRLRPALLLAACEAFGGDLRDALPAAVSLELMHNAFLVHDDIEDASARRRGGAALHVEHGVPLAVHAGDALAVRAVLPLLDQPRLSRPPRAARDPGVPRCRRPHARGPGDGAGVAARTPIRRRGARRLPAPRAAQDVLVHDDLPAAGRRPDRLPRRRRPRAAHRTSGSCSAPPSRCATTSSNVAGDPSDARQGRTSPTCARASGRCCSCTCSAPATTTSGPGCGPTSARPQVRAHRRRRRPPARADARARQHRRRLAWADGLAAGGQGRVPRRLRGGGEPPPRRFVEQLVDFVVAWPAQPSPSRSSAAARASRAPG